MYFAAEIRIWNRDWNRNAEPASVAERCGITLELGERCANLPERDTTAIWNSG